MEQLEVLKKNAIAAYKATDKEGKKLLSNLFGGKVFSEKIADRVNGWQDILDISGRNAKEYELREGETGDELAYRQAKLIAEVYNQGDKLDAMDTNQYKYYPWHKITPGSGFGLSYHDFADWGTGSDVGVRLCFVRSEDAVDAGQKFIEIYSRLKVK